MSETSSREHNARVEAVKRMSTEKSGCDWTWPYKRFSLIEETAVVGDHKAYSPTTRQLVLISSQCMCWERMAAYGHRKARLDFWTASFL